MNRLGTEKNPFVRGDKDTVAIRGWSWCKCNRCGLVSVCSPLCDFYVTDDGYLACEKCVADGLLVLDLRKS